MTARRLQVTDCGPRPGLQALGYGLRISRQASGRWLPAMLPTASATATTPRAVASVSLSFAAPSTATIPTTATPPPMISSAATMDVVPGPMIVVQRYEYTGRELASETSGYYFFRYRSYGPTLGQFFTRDPIGYVDGGSLYAGYLAQEMTIDPKGTVIPPVTVLLAANKFYKAMAKLIAKADACAECSADEPDARKCIWIAYKDITNQLTPKQLAEIAPGGGAVVIGILCKRDREGNLQAMPPAKTEYSKCDG